MSNDGTVSKVTIIGNKDGYTPVKVKDKDTGKSFVINFKNAKVTGNEAEWTIKDGKVYDKNGKTIEDNTLEVTRYQAALIKAAAGNDYDSKFLDEEDLNGAGYADTAKRELQNAKSGYKLAEWNTGLVPDKNGNYVPDMRPAADAGETGYITAEVVNAKGEKGRIIIDMRPETISDNSEKTDKPWWKFW